MFLVDTNIFLEILLDQGKSQECVTFLEHAQKEKIVLVCTHYSLHSIETILSKYKKWKILETFLENIQNMENVHLYSTTLQEEQFISKLAQKHGLDFDDACQYFAAKTTGCKSIVTFDNDFNKTDLIVDTPKKILERRSVQE